MLLSAELIKRYARLLTRMIRLHIYANGKVFFFRRKAKKILDWLKRLHRNFSGFVNARADFALI